MNQSIQWYQSQYMLQEIFDRIIDLILFISLQISTNCRGTTKLYL